MRQFVEHNYFFNNEDAISIVAVAKEGGGVQANVADAGKISG